MGWFWGYLAVGVVVIGLMLWRADATRRQVAKQAEKRWAVATIENQGNLTASRARLQREVQAPGDDANLESQAA